jgi:hypothetical protein
LELLPAGPTERPFVSSVVPFVFRLFPLHPGYVMTVWAEARWVSRLRSAMAMMLTLSCGIDDADRRSILRKIIVACRWSVG